VGATGTGKSSTLNALFNSTVAKVGHGVDPETQIISAYSLHDYLRFHDSAGLGDGKDNDLTHSKNITYEWILRWYCSMVAREI
jgi:predicted GTPase